MSKALEVWMRDLSRRVDELESRLAKLEAGKNYRDGEIIELVKREFLDEDDILCKDLERMVMGYHGVSKSGYKRAIRELKYDRFFAMEKFGVNWAFHRMADADDYQENDDG